MAMNIYHIPQKKPEQFNTKEDKAFKVINNYGYKIVDNESIVEQAHEIETLAYNARSFFVHVAQQVYG